MVKIKQSHIEPAVKFTLFLISRYMEDLFGVSWVKHWAKIVNTWKCEMCQKHVQRIRWLSENQ